MGHIIEKKKDITELVSQMKTLSLSSKSAVLLRAAVLNPGRDKKSVLRDECSPAMVMQILKNHVADVPELLCIYISVIESKICLIIFLESFLLLCITITGDN